MQAGKSGEGRAFLAVEQVSKRFGSFVALDGVSMSVGQGELLCLLGPSGCGKTTLLRIIAGLESQSAGTIRQGGRDISTLPPMERDYGIVFQSYALFPNLTVADNVAYGLVNRRMPRDQRRARVDELLTLVGLPERGNQYPAQLSGGQQQRVAIARALITDPALIVADEPTGDLDRTSAAEILAMMQRLNADAGKTIIMVTHDAHAAAAAGSLVHLEKGELIRGEIA